MNLIKFIVLSSCVFIFSCTPDPLQGFDPNSDNGGTDTGNSNQPDTPAVTGPASAEFKLVAASFRNSCGQPSCHGSTANNGLKVVQIDPTDKEVFDALMTDTLSTDGQRFITAMNPGASNYSIRMTRTSDENGFMPFGGQKNQTELDQVNAWITNGAKFN